MEELKQENSLRSLGLFSVIHSRGEFRHRLRYLQESGSNVGGTAVAVVGTCLLVLAGHYLVRSVEQCGSAGLLCRLGRGVCVLPEDL